jgi:hypothetical protein
MPTANSFGEALLQGLIEAGSNVARRRRVEGQLDEQAEAQRELDRFNFDTEERRRAEDQAQADRAFGLRQQEFDLDFAKNQGRVLAAIEGQKPQKPQTFSTPKAFIANLLAEGNEDEAVRLTRALAEAGRAPKDPPKPRSKGITPVQRDKATQEIFDVKRQEVLDRAGALSPEDLRALSAAGLAQEDPGGFFSSSTPADSTAFKFLQEFNRIGSPEHAQAFERGDSLRQFRPALFQGQGASQSNDERGRAKYPDWDQLTPEQKAQIVELGFPDE